MKNLSTHSEDHHWKHSKMPLTKTLKMSMAFSPTNRCRRYCHSDGGSIGSRRHTNSNRSSSSSNNDAMNAGSTNSRCNGSDSSCGTGSGRRGSSKASGNDNCNKSCVVRDVVLSSV